MRDECVYRPLGELFTEGTCVLAVLMDVADEQSEPLAGPWVSGVFETLWLWLGSWTLGRMEVAIELDQLFIEGASPEHVEYVRGAVVSSPALAGRERHKLTIRRALRAVGSGPPQPFKRVRNLRFKP